MIKLDIVFFYPLCYNRFYHVLCGVELRKWGKRMIQVIKRDGEIADFNLSKITEAIKKAFKATEKDYTEEILQLLSLRVTADFQGKMKDGKISVEQIQDSAEHVLEETGYTDVAKA